VSIHEGVEQMTTVSRPPTQIREDVSSPDESPPMDLGAAHAQ
jgi:hypothetical protein